MSDRIAVMNGGRIVQAGSGRELYETPSSEFVARFFGESNLLDVAVTEIRDDGVKANIGRWSVELGPNPSLRLGGNLRLFLRPDRIRISEAADSFDATVGDITYLGETMRVGLTLRDGPQLVARWPSIMRSIRTGDQLRVAWSASDLRIF
jgi:ABC-type Fe3+/spermidine/putrescine transport system ATPase subunit